MAPQQLVRRSVYLHHKAGAGVDLGIEELRHKLNLTQEALAFKAEVDKTYLNEVENGKRNVSVINLEKVIVALDVTVQSFFTNDLFNGSKRKAK